MPKTTKDSLFIEAALTEKVKSFEPFTFDNFDISTYLNSAQNPSMMYASCTHLDRYVQLNGINAFSFIHGVFSSSVSKEALRQKVSIQ